jgi:hypothetical protein
VHTRNSPFSIFWGVDIGVVADIHAYMIRRWRQAQRGGKRKRERKKKFIYGS